MPAIIQWDRLRPGRGQHGHPRFRSVPTDAFPAKAGPTKNTQFSSGTGSSREEASMDTLDFAVGRKTLSRLKPVLQWPEQR
jgi:hypothetical protein